MEYEELFGTGDVNGDGDIPPREEGLNWIRRCQAVLTPERAQLLQYSGLEYSESLRVAQEAWLQKQRGVSEPSSGG
jgi:hypothetical protein